MNISFKKLSDCSQQPISYLWDPYIPKNAVSILSGNPGQGKSLLTSMLVSKFSKGLSLDNVPLQKPIKSMILNNEDPEGIPADRVFNHGGDRESIIVTNDFFDLREEIFQISEYALSNDVELILVDPVQAYFGTTDFNSATSVRKAMAPLQELAARGVTIILCCHHNKSSGSTGTRLLGSVDFRAAVRSQIALFPYNSAKNTGILVHTKSNLSAKGPCLLYHISEDGQFSIDGETKISEETANLLEHEMGIRKSKLEIASDLVFQQLKKGPQKTSDILNEAEALDVSKRTIERVYPLIGAIPLMKDGIAYRALDPSVPGNPTLPTEFQ